MTEKTLLLPYEAYEMSQNRPTIFIDTRDPADYAASHLPGAVNIRDIFSKLASSTPEGLHELRDHFSALFGDAGFSGKEYAIIYEDAMSTGFGQSCRGYYLMKYLGYPHVYVLHGGFRLWRKIGLPLTDSPTVPTPATFPLSIDTSIMVTTDEMKSALGKPGIVLLDVRDYDEWTGESSSPYGKDFCPRKGRIPGAVWIEWYRMMKETPVGIMFRSVEEILEVCAEVGLTPDTTVYVYCFKGCRAANTLVALREAGFKDVRNYFASWNEWSRDESLPIETSTPERSRMARYIRHDCESC